MKTEGWIKYKMGFLLKKMIATFLMPLPLAVLFILLGLFFLFKRQIKRAKYTFYFTIVWLFVFSYDPFANLILHNIETRYPALNTAPKETQYIYLLGSGHNNDETLPITSQVSNEAIVRLNEAIRLYRQLDGTAKIIVSGYAGPSNTTSHAEMQNRLAQALGVEGENIILASKPRDTEEEAISAKRIIGDAPFILVTSAYHMKRSMAWFEKQGLKPVAAPTFHQTTLNNQNYSKIFSPIALMKSRVVFHEYLGMLWQKIKGK